MDIIAQRPLERWLMTGIHKRGEKHFHSINHKQKMLRFRVMTCVFTAISLPSLLRSPSTFDTWNRIVSASEN